MASAINHFYLLLNALQELAPSALFAYLRYRLRCSFGKTFLSPQLESLQHFSYPLNASIIPLPDKDSLRSLLPPESIIQLIEKADNICLGKTTIFSDYPAKDLHVTGAQHHWSSYARHGVGSLSSAFPHGDIKFIWEVGRLGFIFPLARAYLLTQDQRYSSAFWEHSIAFLEQNPPYQGVHWLSAQEVALRLMALVFGFSIFASSPQSTPENVKFLAWAVMAHAKRIPLTLSYAFAQNNNHLISEAVGLYTAGLALPTYPLAPQWRQKGWQLAHQAFQQQISTDGCYVQHSTNYHRMMLQLALWLTLLWQTAEDATPFPTATAEKLQAATCWLHALVDPESGTAPNLGHNDGSYIFPLTSCEYKDYRPVVQAAARLFLGQPLFDEGSWDEMSLWFSAAPHLHKSVIATAAKRSSPIPSDHEPHVLRLPDQHSWAYLRVARFTSRPAHADQLHVDLWWRGLNIAQDSGTYLYNAEPPWNNIFTSTLLHNTVTINHQEQMQRAGKFLYLHWAQGQLLSHTKNEISESFSAQHDGYQKLGILHQRTLTAFHDGHWEVKDVLKPTSAPKPITARLHWLLLDADYHMTEQDTLIHLSLFYPIGTATLSCTAESEESLLNIRYQLIRAGNLLCGSGEAFPWVGWVSPHYGTKTPALSLAVEILAKPPIRFISTFNFISSESYYL